MNDDTDQHGEGRNALVTEVEQLRAETAKLRAFLAEMNELNAALEAVTEDAELHTLLSRVLEFAARGVGARDASLLVIDETTNDLVFILSIGDVDPESLAWKRIPRGEGVAGWVADNRRATIVNHPQSDERFYGEFDKANTFKTQSILAAPIIGNGRVLGVIELLNKPDGGLFNAHDQTMVGLACTLAGQLLSALTRQTLKAARIQIPRSNSYRPPQ